MIDPPIREATVPICLYARRIIGAYAVHQAGFARQGQAHFTGLRAVFRASPDPEKSFALDEIDVAVVAGRRGTRIGP